MHERFAKPESLAVDLRTAARMLSISPRMLHALARKGEIPSRTVGRRRLFVVSELKRWLEEIAAK